MLSATHYVNGRVANIAPARGAEWAPAQWWEASVPFRPGAATSGSPVPVLANHGRWVVTCPDCHGGQYACRTDPRFMCTDCGNVANRGEFRPIAWPAKVAEIEALLERRPTDLQNTVPTDTLATIVAENKILGVS